MTDIEAIEILKQMKKDTPKMPYECLMNQEMEALDTILLGYEIMCNEVKKLQEENEELKESADYNWEQYQDIGKMYFELNEQDLINRATIEKQQKEIKELKSNK